MTIRDEIRTLRRRRYVRVLFTLFVLCAILVAVVALYKLNQQQRPTPEPSFNHSACVRFFHVDRVYKIRRQEPAHPHRLWFCTPVGIRVFDENRARWTRYGKDHGLPERTISDICFHKNDAWVATWEGLVRYSANADTFITCGYDSPPANGRCMAVAASPEHGIFLAVDQHGIYRIPASVLDTQRRPKKLPLPVKDKERITFLQWHDDTLYIGAENQRLITWTPGDARFAECRFAKASSEGTLIWDVLWKDSACIVATSDNGIWRRNGPDSLFKRDTRFPARGAFVLEAEKDGFWCGTPQGVWRYHSAQDAWVQFVPPWKSTGELFSVVALANTPSRLWYGSMKDGAGFITKPHIEWKPLRAGLSRYNVEALGIGDSFFYAGYGYNGGYIDRFYLDEMQYDKNYGTQDGIRASDVQTLRVRNRTVYYGGSSGFGHFNTASAQGRFFDRSNDALAHDDITDIIFCQDSTICIGSGFGILRSSPEPPFHFQVIGATQQDRITSMAQCGEWILYGTLVHGLKAYHLRKRQIVSLMNPGSRINGIVSVAQDSVYTLFIAVKQHGLYCVEWNDDSLQNVQQVSHDSLDFSDYDLHIMAIARCSTSILTATRSRGCFVYDYSAEKWGKLTYLDGLVSDRVRSLACNDAFVLVGSHGGLSRFEKKYALRRAFENN